MIAAASENAEQRAELLAGWIAGDDAGNKVFDPRLTTVTAALGNEAYICPGPKTRVRP